MILHFLLLLIIIIVFLLFLRGFFIFFVLLCDIFCWRRVHRNGFLIARLRLWIFGRLGLKCSFGSSIWIGVSWRFFPKVLMKRGVLHFVGCRNRGDGHDICILWVFLLELFWKNLFFPLEGKSFSGFLLFFVSTSFFFPFFYIYNYF